MMSVLRKMWHDDEGQDLAEYGLLLALVAVIVAGVIITFRGEIMNAFNNATAALQK